MARYRCLLTVLLAYYCRLTFIAAAGASVDTHGPPKVDTNPIYLDSFVPAAMQLIAHITDLMKYEPAAAGEAPVTGVPTPVTPPHKPGIFAPATPPGHISHHRQSAQTTTTTVTARPWWKLGESRQYPEGYFNRYRHGWSFVTAIVATTPPPPKRSIEKMDNFDLLGGLPSDLYKKINSIPDFEDESDLFGEAQRFTDDYDDRAPPFLRKKRPPPTRAYVTLLSLYDNLNKEAKKLTLNKYAGYSKKTLEDLERFSKGTSASQLENVLRKVIERRDITQTQIVKKIETLLEDFAKSGSYIHESLKDIPPLAYDINF